MTAMTLAISVLALALGVVLRPQLALAVYLSMAILWPEYMRVDVAPIELSAHRLGALGLLLGAAIRMRGWPRPHIADAFFVAWWIWGIMAKLIGGAPSGMVSTTIGRGLDTVLIYLAVRLSIHAAHRTPRLHPLLVVAAVAAMLLALYETTANKSFYDPLFLSDPGRFDYPMFRHGFMRAKGSTAQPIYWGVTMLLFAGLMLLHAAPKWGVRTAIACGIALVGAGASWSSGPWIGCVMLFAVAAMYWCRWAVKPVAVTVVLALIALQLAANRNVYEFAMFLGLDRQTAWYRGRLIEVAIMKLPEYWLYGYGSETVTDWAPLLDGRRKVDLVNGFVYTAVQAGLPALVCYVGAKVSCMVCAVKLAKSGIPTCVRQGFALGAAVLSISFVEMSVGLFSTPLVLHAALLAHGPALLAQYQAYAKRRAAAPASENPEREGRRPARSIRGLQP